MKRTFFLVTPFFLVGLFILIILGSNTFLYEEPQYAEAAGQGHIVKYGNKWGWENGDAFIPQLVMYRLVSEFYNNPSRIDADISSFIGEHGFNGFHVSVSCRWFDMNEDVCSSSDTTFDQRTFDALKMLIQKTHTAGGMVHLWMWGDDQRGQTPRRLDGIMGTHEKRLIDKIASEFGSLPGWSIGYGFDLDEWVTESQLRQVRDYFHTKLPVHHFIGGRPAGPNRGSNHSQFASWNANLDYASYEHHQPSYDVYVSALNANPGKPVFSEDRFRIRSNVYPEKDYTEERTRQGLWDSAMAGGVANIWGRLQGGSEFSLPYQNKALIKTYSRFFENRFRKGLTRDNQLTSGGYGLRDGGSHALIFKRDTNSVAINLSGKLSGSLPVVAVDAKKPYAEINIGPRSGNSTWSAPYFSDWAIAVGNFGSVDTPGPVGQSGPCNLYQSRQAAPTGYGAAWNTLTGAKGLFLESYCNSNGSITYNVGVGEPTHYIYDTGYFYANNQWNAFSLTGTYVENSTDWLIGEGAYTNQNPPQGDYFWVSYVCQWQTNTSEWKCGCRDEACTQNFWQLQGVVR